MNTRILPPLLLAALVAACGSDSKSDSSKSDKQESYPATEAGLVKLINDVESGAYKGELSQDLAVPDAWLTSTYGPVLGQRFIDEKKKFAPMYGTLAKILSAQKKRGRTEVSAKKYEGQSDHATTLQNYTMKAMKTKAPIFSVHMREKGKPHGGMHLYSWVHVDGKWRFLSRGLPTLKLDKLPSDPQKRAFLESSKATRDRILGGKK